MKRRGRKTAELKKTKHETFEKKPELRVESE
jgi:hypothetical protein